MSHYQGLLTNILRNISNSTLFALHIFHANFINSVIAYFNSYLSSKYVFLVEMYPVHFMHLAFYDVYCKTYYPHYDINFFSNFFIPHQLQSGIKYKTFILVLKENCKNIEDFSNTFNNDLSVDLGGNNGLGVNGLGVNGLGVNDDVNVLVNYFENFNI
jgi:hypothetical protein